jgi:hypothetical protein
VVEHLDVCINLMPFMAQGAPHVSPAKSPQCDPPPAHAKKYRAADAGEKTWQERFDPSLADSQCSWSIVGDMVTVFALVAHVNRQ